MRKMFRRKNRSSGSAGCIYLLMMCLTACVLLIFNGLVVSAIYDWYAPNWKAMTENQKFEQGVKFVTPVVLIFCEYLVYDFLVDRSEQVT